MQIREDLRCEELRKERRPRPSFVCGEEVDGVVRGAPRAEAKGYTR